MKSNRVVINEGDLVILSGGSSWTIRKITSWLQAYCDRRGLHSVAFEGHENPEIKETSITVISGISIDEAFERDVLDENS